MVFVYKKAYRLKKRADSFVSLNAPRYYNEDGSEGVSLQDTLLSVEDERHRLKTLDIKKDLNDLVSEWLTKKDEFLNEFKSLFNYKTSHVSSKRSMTNLEKFYNHLNAFFSNIKYKDVHLVELKRNEIVTFLQDLNFSSDVTTEEDNLVLILMFLDSLRELMLKYPFLEPFKSEIFDLYVQNKSKIVSSSENIVRAFLDSLYNIELNIKSDYNNYSYWKFVEARLCSLSQIFSNYLKEKNLDVLKDSFNTLKKEATLNNLVYDKLFNLGLEKYFPYIKIFQD